MEDTDSICVLREDGMAGILPVDSAFTGGTMHLSNESAQPAVQDITADSQDKVTGILTSICILVMILSIRKLVNVIPSLLGCLFRWKEAFNLEYNLKLSRDRNLVFLILILPFCLMVSRFGIYSPEFLSGAGQLLRLAAFTGIFIAYLLLRRLLGTIFKSAEMDGKAWSAAQMLFLTFFCLATVCCLAGAGILSYTGLPDNTIRIILIHTVAFFYLVFIFRKIQIFSHYCSVFSTILYLCTLEILPTGLLVASAIFL